MATKLFVVKVETTDHDQDLFAIFPTILKDRFRGSAMTIADVTDAKEGDYFLTQTGTDTLRYLTDV